MKTQSRIDYENSHQYTLNKLRYPEGAFDTAKALAANDKIVSRDFTVPWNKVSRAWKTFRKTANRKTYGKILATYQHHYGRGDKQIDEWIEWLSTPLHD
jgi:hypothetical protein